MENTMRLRISILATMLMLTALTAPALAQTDNDIGSVLVSFNLADLEPGVTERLSGLSLEADLKVPGTVLSFVGHVSDHGEVKFTKALGRASRTTSGRCRFLGTTCLEI